jgi:hypothetical protein
VGDLRGGAEKRWAVVRGGEDGCMDTRDGKGWGVRIALLSL